MLLQSVCYIYLPVSRDCQFLSIFVRPSLYPSLPTTFIGGYVSEGRGGCPGKWSVIGKAVWISLDKVIKYLRYLPHALWSLIPSCGWKLEGPINEDSSVTAKRNAAQESIRDREMLIGFSHWFCCCCYGTSVKFFDQIMYCFKIIFLILITYSTLGLKNSGIKCKLSYLLTDF